MNLLIFLSKTWIFDSFVTAFTSGKVQELLFISISQYFMTNFNNEDISFNTLSTPDDDEDDE